MACFGDNEDKESQIKSRITTDRKCRDVFFLILFGLFLIGSLVLTGIAFAKGDPTVLLLGTDYRGDLCGLDNEEVVLEVRDRQMTIGGSINHTLNLETFPFRYFVNPNEMLDSFIDIDNIGEFEMDDMFDTDDEQKQAEDFRLKDAKSICLPACPSNVFEDDKLTWVCNYPDGYGEFEKTSRYYGNPSDTIDCADDLDSDLCKGSTLLTSWKEGKFSYFDDLVQRSTNDSIALESVKSSLRLEGPCYPILMPTVDMYSTCQPFQIGTTADTNVDKSKEALEAFNTLRNDYGVSDVKSEISFDTFEYMEKAINELLSTGTARFQRYIGDIKASWDVILVGGLVVPLVLGSLWLVVMRYLSGVFAWGVVILSNLGMIAFTFVLYIKAGIITTSQVSGLANKAGYEDFDFSEHSNINPEQGDHDTIAIFAYIFTFLTVLLIVATCFMAKRIKIAVASLQEAAIAVEKTPTVLFFPIIMSFVIMAIGMWWIWTAVYLYSAGDLHRRDLIDECMPSIYNKTPLCEDKPTKDCADACGFEIHFNKQLRYAMLYHLFALLWSTQFIIGYTLCVIAGVISHYYWAREEKNSVISSVKRTNKYHMGSIAIGSFFVAFFQFIRIVLTIIEKQGKKVGANDNKFAKFAFKCLQCLLALIQKIIEIINRNTYIMIAIDGESYCESAKKAVNLLTSNMLIFLAVNTIGDAILFLGKLLIVIISALISFSYLDQEKYNDTVSSPFLPVLMVTVLAYMIANIFMGVVEMAVDTLVLSFCLDKQENNGAIRYAPPKLVQLVDQVKKDDKTEKVGIVTKNPVGDQSRL